MPIWYEALTPNAKAVLQFILNLMYAAAGVLVAADKPNDWWGVVRLLAGVFMACHGVKRGTWGEIPHG